MKANGDARAAVWEARCRLLESRHGKLRLDSGTLERVSRRLGAGDEFDSEEWASLAALQSRVVLDGVREGFGLLGGPHLTADVPVPVMSAAAAVDAIGSTRTLDRERSQIDLRLFDRLLGAADGIVARVAQRLPQKMEARAMKAAKEVRKRRPADADRIEKAIGDRRLLLAEVPLSARAMLTAEQEGVIAQIVADERALVESFIGDAQEATDRSVAAAADADAAVVVEAMASTRRADRDRAIDMFLALVATTMINRYNAADDSSTPLEAPIARGIVWDTISVAGGADATAANGLSVAEDGRFIVDGAPARGRYLGQGEKTLRLVEDLNEAKSGSRAGVTPEYTFHQGSFGQNGNEIHRRKDRTKWRDGEYRDKMFDSRSGTLVAPGQYPGCECWVESVLVETDAPGPRAISETEASEAVA